MATDSEAAPRPWLRVRFAKVGKVRFTSHRDVARAFERAVRRVGLPVAWSKGFSPRPLLSFGLALPTGAESVAEYLDVRLTDPFEPPDLAGSLTEALPEGIMALVVAPRAGDVGSLQQAVTSCSWELEVDGVSGQELASRIERFRSSPTVTVTTTRRGNQVLEDVRPLIRDLRPLEPPGVASSPWLAAEVGAQPRGLRPAELVGALGTDLVLLRSRRTHQWIERDGDRSEPLCWPGAPEARDAAGT